MINNKLLVISFIFLSCIYSTYSVAEASFNDRVLHISHVKTDNSGSFLVDLELVDGKFVLTNAVPTSAAEDSTTARFFSNLLEIPKVSAFDKHFLVTLALNTVGNFFEIETAVEINENSNDDNYGKNILNLSSPLAVNVAPFAAWTPGWVLIDLFPKAQQWVSNICISDQWGSGPELSLDNNGWVTSLPDGICADTSVLASQAGHYPEGTYVLLWEGDGTFSAQWDVEPEITHFQEDIVEQRNNLNRMTFEITKSQQTDLGIGFRIQTLANDYIKNIRLIPPGGMCGRSAIELDPFKYCATSRGGTGSCSTDETCHDFEEIYWDRFVDSKATMNNPKPVFHPLYASSYQQYQAVRYMKWGRSEQSLVEDWNDRVSVREQPFTNDDRGLPIEYMLAFSNLLNADAYLNIPMRTTNDFNRSYATLVKDMLNSNLNFYLEYGNEVFNNSPEQEPYVYALSQAELANSGIPATDSDLIKIAKYTSEKSLEIFQTWADVLGSEAHRMTRVLVGFNPLPEFTLTVLDHKNAFEHIDALAINGYIGPNRNFIDDRRLFDSMDIDALFAEISNASILNSGSSLIDLNDQYKQHASYAQQRGIRLIAYEGGNFMGTNDAPKITIDMFMAANRDRRMGNFFVGNIENFRDAGGETFFYFLNEDLWNADGSFGARQFQD